MPSRRPKVWHPDARADDIDLARYYADKVTSGTGNTAETTARLPLHALLQEGRNIHRSRYHDMYDNS